MTTAYLLGLICLNRWLLYNRITFYIVKEPMYEGD